jgi:hypothetical protein
MKFQWMKNEPFTQELLESWTLWLADKGGAPLRRMGTLYQLEDKSYVLLERKHEATPYFLDADLSLEEALRAAKLFLCVGVAA